MTDVKRVALLEYIARFASIVTKQGDRTPEALAARRILRYALQDQAGYLMSGERVRSCLRRRIPIRKTVDIYRSKSTERAHYGGLMVCGSVWMCPVCAVKVTESRRGELEDVTSEFHGAKGLVTFTLQHKSFEQLYKLYGGLNDSYRALKAGRWWESFESNYSILGSVRGTEVTWGESSGWHPHFHTLFLFDKSPDDFTQDDRSSFETEIKIKFQQMANARGFYVSPEFGVNVSFDQDNISTYAAKWGMESELAKSPAKIAKGESGEHYTGFQLLLESAINRNKRPKFEGLFKTYANTMKGKKQLVWSKGARDLFGLGEDPTDAELAEGQEPDAYLFASLRDDQWKKVLVAAARGQLLEVASLGDVEKLKVYLKSLGVILE